MNMMKKRFFCLLIMLGILLSVTACSSEPVAFSETLSNNRNCYMDVLEIYPETNDYPYYGLPMRIGGWQYRMDAN